MKEEYFKNYFNFYSEGISGNFDRIASYYEDDYGKLLPEDKNIRILDIGCGMGHFLYYLSKKGYTNIKGVDLCDEQVKAAQKNVPLASIEKITDLKKFLSDNKETYDLITMNDVLEHLSKDMIMDTLSHIRNKLSNSGVFICRVPNLSNIFGIYLFYNDFTHCVGFTEYSIRQVLELAGFKDINVYANFTRINSFWKKILFTILRQIIFSITKLILAYIYMPGSRQPKIMTTFLIATAKKD